MEENLVQCFTIALLIEKIFESATNFKDFSLHLSQPISGRVDRASATEAVDMGLIPGWVKPKTLKSVFTAFLLDIQQSKGLCEASTVCGRQVGRWQLDSKIE